MKYVLLLALTLLTACGRSGFLDTSIFTKYIEIFQRESIVYRHPAEVTDLVIKFSSDLDDKIVGQCRQQEGATPLILINVSWWEKLTVDQKEILLLHEMGHCVLGLSHDDTRPAIMNTFLLGGYGDERKELLAYYFEKSLDVVAALRYSVNRKAGYVPDRCRN